MSKKEIHYLQSIAFSREEVDHVISRTTNTSQYKSAHDNSLMNLAHQSGHQKPQYQCRCYSDGEVTIENISTGETKMIGKFPKPMQTCCFVSTSTNTSFGVLLVLCSGNFCCVYKEPFEEPIVNVRLKSSSVITCVCGVMEESTCFLMIGHFNGQVSALRIQFGSWLRHELLTVRRSGGLGDDKIECGEAQVDVKNHFPSVFKLKVLKFEQERKMGDHHSIFSSDLMNNKTYLLSRVSLAVLTADDKMTMYDIGEGYLDEIVLRKIYQYRAPPLSLDMKIVDLVRYIPHLSAKHRDPFTHALLIAGHNAAHILLVRQYNQSLMVERIICNLSVSSALTSITSVCTRNENSCDMTLFCGSNEGVLFRGRIPQKMLEGECKEPVSLKEIQGKRLHSFVMDGTFSEYGGKKLSFHDHLNYRIRL